MTNNKVNLDRVVFGNGKSKLMTLKYSEKS